MKKSDKSLRAKGERLGKSKTQAYNLDKAGLLTPENEVEAGDLFTQKLRAEIADKKKATELKQIKIDREARKLIPASIVAEFVTRMAAICTSTADFILLTRLPQMNAGLDAVRQRINNEPEANELRRKIQDEALRFIDELETDEN